MHSAEAQGLNHWAARKARFSFFKKEGPLQLSTSVGLLGETCPTCPSILWTDRTYPLGLDLWMGQGHPPQWVSSFFTHSTQHRTCPQNVCWMDE